MSTAATPAATPARSAVPPVTSCGEGGVRASDAEREAVVTRLHEALGEGRLDLAENEARVAAAYAARHRHDLPPLLADLPGTSPFGPGAPTWSAIAAAILGRLRLLLGRHDGDVGASPAPSSARGRGRAAAVVALVVVWLILCAAAGALLA